MATTRGLLLAAAVVALAAWAACGLPLHHQAAALHDHPLLGQLGSLNQVQLHGARQLREALAWPENSEDLPMHAKLRHWMRALDQRLHKYRSPDNGIHGGFFEWLPAFTAAAIPHQAAVSWSTRCYSSNTARVVAYTSLGAEIEITVAEPTGSSACQQNEDFYAVITMEGIHFLHVTKPETHRILWSGKEWTDADKTWIARHGFRFFLFPGTVSQTITQLADTVSLFVPALMEQTVSPDAEKRNVEFLSQSINYTMEKREVTDVFLDESLLNDGDFLGIMRLDGLDTMLAWAMGAHTGHTAITLRIDGELYVCESTVNDSYWPTNGVQRTPYAQWFKQAKAAGHVVVHLPLSPESRQLFNSTAAVEFFKTVEGLPYGYHNMLFAWVDTVNDNYPAPLVAELHELLAGLFDRVDRTMATSFWGMAFNKRLNTENLTVIEAINAGDEKGLPFPQLMALPEQDAWSYTDGKSLVCDVLVCEMWKAAGLLGDLADQVQCTEFTNWDAYSLNVFDANYVRPAACVAADPDSQFCQLLGNYRMTLPGYNSRPIRPHMAENCPRGLPPNFDKPDGC